MPLLRFDIVEGRDQQAVERLLDAAHEAVLESLNVPTRDRYQVVHQHPAHEIVLQDTGLGINRSKNVVLITVVSVYRDDALKQALYKALVDKLSSKCDIRPEDVMVSLVENTKADWSFAYGEAQFLNGKL